MKETIANRFHAVRSLTVKLIEELNPEDTVVQPVVDVSPPKWHLGHTTWFFENFILKNFIPGYKTVNDHYDYLFNSYYQGQGKRVQRDMRGFHPRPLLQDVRQYRLLVDDKILELLSEQEDNDQLLSLVELGINHEQQHQELLLTDLKFIWSYSPFNPVYVVAGKEEKKEAAPLLWLPVNKGLYKIGESGHSFHYDNESPHHQVYLDGFEIASRPVTIGEYLEFVADKGYEEWRHWLHEGWIWVNENEVRSPLYWKKIESTWYSYTLSGLRRLNENETLTHISFYEADAFARWKGYRLPTEQEWETAASKYGNKDAHYNFLDNEIYNPSVVDAGDKAFFGQVWEWTNSAYLPYPRFEPWTGNIGEYNGKFMINQMVLRGGSCVTPKNHIRLTYRNFFHPHLRWQFTGIRLAKNLQ